MFQAREEPGGVERFVAVALCSSTKVILYVSPKVELKGADQMKIRLFAGGFRIRYVLAATNSSDDSYLSMEIVGCRNACPSLFIVF